jgi:hypothetical protein
MIAKYVIFSAVAKVSRINFPVEKTESRKIRMGSITRAKNDVEFSKPRKLILILWCKIYALPLRFS